MENLSLYMYKFYLIIFTFLLASFEFQAHSKNYGTEFKIKMATMSPEGSPYDKALKIILNNIKRNTKGKIRYKYYNSGMLGDELSMIKFLKKGKIQMWGGSLGALSVNIPELSILELPYLFMNNSEVDKVILETEIDSKRIMEKYGFVFYVYSEVGWRSMAFVKKRISKLNDLAGMNIRSQESKVHLEMWKALGANPIPINLIETIKALQVKIVDGLDNSPMWLLATSWYNSINYFSLTKHIYQPAVVVFNKIFFKGLPTLLQKQALLEKQKAGDLCKRIVRNFESEVFNIFKSSGIEITNISEKDRKKMQKATEVVHKIYLKSTTIDGKKLYDKIRKILNK